MLLNKIKILLGIPSTDTAQDELLMLLIEMAQDEAVGYCRLGRYIEKLNPAVTQMVIERYNRIGAEGITSAATSGISESYIDGYSKQIYSLLDRYRRGVMIL